MLDNEQIRMQIVSAKLQLIAAEGLLAVCVPILNRLDRAVVRDTIRRIEKLRHDVDHDLSNLLGGIDAPVTP